ncbi:hypothetical protein ASPNIDRAFT_135561, partial [Aspergillus niger ATCC 1015]
GHNVVLASLPKGSQGTASTAAVAIHPTRTFPAIELRCCAPDGIMGGDVEYDMGKEITSGFRRKGISCPPPTESPCSVESRRKFLSDILRNHPGLREYHRPLSETDTLYPAAYTHGEGGGSCASCDKTEAIQWRPRMPSNESCDFYGNIASGNRMISNSRKRDMMATEYGGSPCIVIRGSLHYCDSHQNDDWHAYAAGAAAALAKDTLTYVEPLRMSPNHLKRGH